MPNSGLRTASEIKQAVLSNQDTITISSYCKRYSKHLSLPNKTPYLTNVSRLIKHHTYMKLSSQIAKNLTTGISQKCILKYA